MVDLAFNLGFLAVDVAALSMVRARPGWVGVLAGATLAAAAAGFLAIVYTIAIGWHPMFATMRFSAWALFLHGPLLLLGGAFVLRERRAWKLGLPVAAAALCAVAIDAFFIEPRALELRRFEIESSKLDRPLRIGVIADLQTDAPGEYERRALEMVLAEQPDVILFPGDFVHELEHEERLRDWDAVNAMFHDVGLAAPLGLFAVPGDVDTVGWGRVLAGFDAELFPATRAAEIDLPDGGGVLRITGLSYRDGRDTRLTLPATDAFHIVLGHRPDFALSGVDADLLIAGHTHGGQVKLPWFGAPVLLSAIPRAWGDGRTELDGGGTLIVSRGVGMERGHAPRLRFLCRPEVVVIDVLPAAAR